MPAPRIIIIAGPNGAGKTTFAREFLPVEADCGVFINADLIAAGLSPFAPERAAIQAGRLMLATMAQHVRRGESFAFETTLAGRGYAQQIPVWRQSGYVVKLFFLSLPSAEMAIERVAQRVRAGGHDIPSSTIRRRWRAGRRLLEATYKELVDHWVLYDNAGEAPLLLDWGPSHARHEVREPEAARTEFPPTADADLRGSLAAIRRAAQRAREAARRSETELIVLRDGRIMRIRPQPAAVSDERVRPDG